MAPYTYLELVHTYNRETILSQIIEFYTYPLLGAGEVLI